MADDKTKSSRVAVVYVDDDDDDDEEYTYVTNNEGWLQRIFKGKKADAVVEYASNNGKDS